AREEQPAEVAIAYNELASRQHGPKLNMIALIEPRLTRDLDPPSAMPQRRRSASDAQSRSTAPPAPMIHVCPSQPVTANRSDGTWLSGAWNVCRPWVETTTAPRLPTPYSARSEPDPRPRISAFAGVGRATNVRPPSLEISTEPSTPPSATAPLVRIASADVT